jgi:hypothetical protein
LNTVESGYRAKVYKFNNRKNDAVFSNAIAEEFYRPPSKQVEVRFLEMAKRGSFWEAIAYHARKTIVLSVITR